MVRVSVTETLFKSIDTNATRIQVHHCASEFSAPDVALKLQRVLKAAPAHHRTRMLLTGVTVPFAMVFLTALPGPNVVLYWAAYRTYAHYTAWQGARHLSALLARADDAVVFVDAPHLAGSVLGEKCDVDALMAEYEAIQRADFELALAQATRRNEKTKET